MKYELALKPKDVKGLEGSIEKWERVLKGGVEEGTSDCPLCDLYCALNCRGCPVKEWTGGEECSLSPYTTWVTHLRKKHCVYFSGRKTICPTCKRIAQKELDFLKHLLKIGVPW